MTTLTQRTFSVDGGSPHSRGPQPRAARRAAGRAARAALPLAAHAELASTDRVALDLLRAQESDREPELVPLRYERMMASPFAYLRGAAAVMAADLAASPRSGILVQLCGDAHVANFGMFAAPDRRLVFDINDFDETLPGPFEWDVKRLAASVVVAGRHVGVKDKRARAAAAATVASYRTTMRTLSGLGPLQVWYARVDVEPLVRRLKGTSLATGARKAQRASLGGTGEVATAKLTKVVDGQRRFRNRPPLLVAVDDEHYPGAFGHAAELYRGYLATLSPEQLILLRQYAVTGLAHKVVGVGSVGTRALVLLLESGDRDVLLLQVKQANESVLAHHLGSSEYENQGRRVVVGQRLMQAAGDPLLGWARRSEQAPYDFYVRQLKDMKGSFDLDSLHGADLELYARICGAVLARAHARAGDAAAIRGYLGSSTAFDGAVTAWALEYADRTEADHGALVETLRRDPAEQGVRPA